MFANHRIVPMQDRLSVCDVLMFGHLSNFFYHFKKIKIDVYVLFASGVRIQELRWLAGWEKAEVFALHSAKWSFVSSLMEELMR